MTARASKVLTITHSQLLYRQGEFNRLARFQWKPHDVKGLSDPRLFWSYKREARAAKVGPPHVAPPHTTVPCVCEAAAHEAGGPVLEGWWGACSPVGRGACSPVGAAVRGWGRAACARVVSREGCEA